MDKTVKKLLTGGQKPASSLKMDLDGELVVERNYRKTLFALRIPYRGKLRWGKVKKFSSSIENFPRRKFSPAKIFPDETFATTNILPGE